MTRGVRTKCYYCGQDEACSKDHFIPLSKRGFLTVWACRVCQYTKGNMMPLEWVEYVKNHSAFKPEYVIRVETSVRSLWSKVLNKEIKAYHLNQGYQHT